MLLAQPSQLRYLEHRFSSLPCLWYEATSKDFLCICAYTYPAETCRQALANAASAASPTDEDDNVRSKFAKELVAFAVNANREGGGIAAEDLERQTQA